LKKVVLLILTMAVIFSLVMCGCSGSRGVGDAGISLAEFNKIQVGMAWSDAEAIIGDGCQGDKMSENENKDNDIITTVMVYRYKGETKGYAEIEYTATRENKPLGNHTNYKVTAKHDYDLE